MLISSKEVADFAHARGVNEKPHAAMKKNIAAKMNKFGSAGRA
ncbi:hypothetical protein PDESU_01029 [Pontiella desulfatans]|uniref:Uncharacterized protein n=1 Tax=Pontiella desulfatans TaxID=2750659 RepID=A0A6C2TZ58_PONDE|nr:hypothetical protein [Pontiella desulfatans]VGO12476.1 hypothetical protein PDESU_01029 [Pontiella desulfatans]